MGTTDGKSVVKTEKDLKSIFPKTLEQTPFANHLVCREFCKVKIVMEYLVKFAKDVIQIEESQLKLGKLDEYIRNRKCNCRCYL